MVLREEILLKQICFPMRYLNLKSYTGQICIRGPLTHFNTSRKSGQLSWVLMCVACWVCHVPRWFWDFSFFLPYPCVLFQLCSLRFIPLSGFFYFFRSAAADLRTFAASAGLEALGQQWNQQKMVIWCQTGSVTQLMHASVKLCVGGSAPTGEQWHAGTTISFWTCWQSDSNG